MDKRIFFLTDKQQLIVSFIADTMREKGRPARLTEIANYMKVNGATIHEHLQAIIKKGYIRKIGRYYMPINTRCPTCGGVIL